MQTPTPQLIAEDWFRGLFRRLFFALDALRPLGTLPPPIAAPALLRLDRIYHLVVRLIALVRQGRYKPRRRTGKPRPHAARRARPPDPLPRKFGWLARLLPQTAGSHRGDLSDLLQHPDMVALIQAAPIPLIPPLRSLCWALGFKPPPVLARPRPPAPQPPTPQPATPEPPTPEPPTVRPPTPQPPPPQSKSPTAPPPPAGPGPDPPHPA